MTRGPGRDRAKAAQGAIELYRLDEVQPQLRERDQSPERVGGRAGARNLAQACGEIVRRGQPVQHGVKRLSAGRKGRTGPVAQAFTDALARGIEKGCRPALGTRSIEM